MEPKLDEQTNQLESTRQTVKKFEAAIAQVEDQIFSDFCKRLGYADIRAYEAQQGSQQEQAAEKRTEFEVQKERLNSNLTWQQKRLSDLEERREKMGQQIERIEKDLSQFDKEKGRIRKAINKEQAELERLSEKLEAVQSKHAEKADKVQAAKAELQARAGRSTTA